ncbi:MAG: 23S rRNA (adenine(2503)-C(2))-methyltransferase RlmN [Planctomycetota bacterium]
MSGVGLGQPATHFFGLDEAGLRSWCAERGMAAFRAKQIGDWVYEHGVIDPEQMSNLSKADRAALSEMTFLSGRTVAHQVATDGTQKLLVQWAEGEGGSGGGGDSGGDGDGDGYGDSGARSIDAREGTLSRSLPVLGAAGFDYDAGDPTRQTECVMIPELSVAGDGSVGDGSGVGGGRGALRGGAAGGRRTACISSQVGCPVGCRFCASGLSGLDGNLSAGRIVEQVWRLQQLEGVGRISNVVFMGMGEPLANFRAVVGAVRTLARAKPFGMGISARKITVSTVGMHRAIEKLADELDLPITLALSLHAPNDELRRRLIPWAEFTTIDQLLSACDRWFRKTGREITLEYTLLHRVNDQPEHAAELVRVAKRLRANVNLIRYNEVDGLEFGRPEDDAVRGFQAALRAGGVNVHIRASRGRDIAAACGQLRHETAGA